jgi:cytochrome b subunit of formate dehydrogenase
MVITSFLALAITGMTIKFANVPVFQTVADIMGGVEVTKFIHRVAAVITFAYFVLHVSYLFKKKRRRKQSWKEFLFTKNSLVPNKKDIIDFKDTMKWFIGKGQRPEYGKWTYWEKFDYFAVFWGVAVIGSTGLLLWFSEFFTSLGIPGWLINVATIIHSDEALLATGFIFTIHFFNTHFRPDKFPMDNVIFTGSIPVEELEYDRPEQYKELVENNELEEHIVEAPPENLKKSAKIFGFTALTLGILFILLIIYSMIFLYQ